MVQHDNAACQKIVSDFVFTDIRAAEPPAQRGVYAIRVVSAGIPIPDLLQQTSTLIEHLRWPMVERKMLNRVHRLHQLGPCPLIYIGSAGTRSASHNTLRGRYEEFAGRHTIMFPLWTLLYFGWNLEYGWLVVEQADVTEAERKLAYQQQHAGLLPALVHR